MPASAPGARSCHGRVSCIIYHPAIQQRKRLMSSRRMLWLLGACALVFYVVITGCSSNATFYDPAGSVPPSTAAPNGAATTAAVTRLPHALAWFQPDSHQV